MKSEKNADYLEYVFYGLLALVILLLPDILLKDNLDIWLMLALGCFAAAVPFLALCLIFIYYKRHKFPDYTKDAEKQWMKYMPFVITVAIIFGIFGIFFVFAHANIFTACLFSLSVLIVTLIHFRCIKE